jgi:serine/threonine protein kinase
MLHRDISPNNLMLVHSDGENESVLRRGLLIDFDYAAILEELGERVVSAGFRTVRLIGTLFQFDLLILHHSGYTAFHGYRPHASSRETRQSISA